MYNFSKVMVERTITFYKVITISVMTLHLHPPKKFYTEGILSLRVYLKSWLKSVQHGNIGRS